MDKIDSPEKIRDCHGPMALAMTCSLLGVYQEVHYETHQHWLWQSGGSFGRKTASVLLMDTDHVILSAMTPEVIGQRSTEQLRKYEEDENE